jgi:hypothetical protein
MLRTNWLGTSETIVGSMRHRARPRKLVIHISREYFPMWLVLYLRKRWTRWFCLVKNLAAKRACSGFQQV